MRADLPYASGSGSVQIPSGVDAEYIAPGETTVVKDPGDALHRACTNPVGAGPLADALDRHTNVLIVVSDLTRGGVREILPTFVEYIGTFGVSAQRIKVLVARGTHRALNKEEKQFFKARMMPYVTVEEHDCDDSSRLSALVLTRRGTPVRVNRALREADVVILLSNISFHYFAGFGGGRKLILPGCADRGSIMANHRLSMLETAPIQLHPECRAGHLDGNPVHEDMCEALTALGTGFGINFFYDTQSRVIFVNAGDPIRSHVEACVAYRELFGVPVDTRADVMLLSAGGAPYDINLLQAHKALRNAAGAVRNGGSILFYAACPEGIGSESLTAALSVSAEQFAKQPRGEYGLNHQTAVSLRALTQKFRVGMVTELVDEPLFECGVERCENSEAFLARALETHRTDRVVIIPFGSHTLPFKREGE